MFVPQLILKQLYTRGSLHNTDAGVCFSIKNRLMDVIITRIESVEIDREHIPLEKITLEYNTGHQEKAYEISKQNQKAFPLRDTMKFICDIPPLNGEMHKIWISFSVKNYGNYEVKVEDAITPESDHLIRIPRQAGDDYKPESIVERQKFIEDFSNEKFEHIFQYSIDPQETRGNIEHFTGVVEIPLGIAGPIHINGENAQGEYLVPLATTLGPGRSPD